MTSQSAIPVGTPVMTSDGSEIGKVKEVEGEAFKIDAPAQPDYWLARSAVMQVIDGCVIVGFEGSHIEDFRFSSREDALAPDALQVLLQMHGELKAGFRTIFETADPVLAREHWEELRTLLEAHEELEDTYVFGALAHEGTTDSVLAGWPDEHHRQVRDTETVLEAIEIADPSDTEWRNDMVLLREMLERHMHMEERDIFPRVREAWSDERLIGAGREMLASKARLLNGHGSGT